MKAGPNRQVPAYLRLRPETDSSPQLLVTEMGTGLSYWGGCTSKDERLRLATAPICVATCSL